MVNLLHQLQQAPYFTFWETLAREPIKILAWQIGNYLTFVFAIWHGGA